MGTKKDTSQISIPPGHEVMVEDGFSIPEGKTLEIGEGAVLEIQPPTLEEEWLQVFGKAPIKIVQPFEKEVEKEQKSKLPEKRDRSSEKKPGEPQPHSLLIWEACQNLEKKIGREAKPQELWNHLKTNLRKCDPAGMILLEMDLYTLKYVKSNGTNGELTRDNLRHLLYRIRKNPPT